MRPPHDLVGQRQPDAQLQQRGACLGGGSVAIASCGDGCLNISLGRVGDNYWCPASGCQIYDQSGFINVQNGAAITSAVLVRAKLDDRIWVYLGGSPPNSGLVWQSDGTWFPPLTWAPGVQCDLHTSYDENPSVDVTSILQAGGSIPFNVRVSVGGCGEGYVQLQVHYNTSVLNYDTWASAADTASVLSTLQMGSVCTSSLTCTAMPALDGNGCAPQTVGRICPSWFTSPTTLAMAAYVNPLCTQVQVASQCNAAAGQMACFIDYQGNQQCYANTGSSADNCVALRTNPACSYVNTQCIETAANGVCTVAVDTYDCGGSVNVAGPTAASQAIACTGPTRCMGTECVSSTLEFEWRLWEGGGQAAGVGDDGGGRHVPQPERSHVMHGVSRQGNELQGRRGRLCQLLRQGRLGQHRRLHEDGF